MSKLYIVGTPIGNLEDISLRALKTLRRVNFIACEDTRKTKQLLRLLKIEYHNKKFFAHHDFNEHHSAQGIVKILQNNHEVALVSDAGMPTISDPGYKLISQVLKHDLPLEVIPGPTAVIVANILANFRNEFTFLGFLKDKKLQRLKQLKKLSPNTYVAFVSPHKLKQTLQDIHTIFGDNIEVFLGKELTKMFEKHYRGTILQIIDKFSVTAIKGEYTIVIDVK